MWKVQLFELNYDEREEQAVLDVLRSRWITMGEKTLEFERQFAKHLGLDSGCLAVSSATAALHMALMALDIGEGDEVIVPSLTFVSDLNVIRRVGASPVLADSISYDDWTVSPDSIRSAISDKTKAIMVVHYAGYACAMDDIMAIAQKHDLYVIEDAAHCPGATFGDRALGTIGDIGCFSFFTNKNLSVGEGGMYVTQHERLLERGRLLRSQGMSTMTLDRHKGRSAAYDVIEPGLNYRIDEMRAALGLVQLEKLPDGNARRAAITGEYRKRLQQLEGIQIPFIEYSRGEPSYHIFPILLERGLDRAKIMEVLKQAGVQSSIHYPDPQCFTAYAETAGFDTPIAADISTRCLTLPLFPTMSKNQTHEVCGALETAVQRFR